MTSLLIEQCQVAPPPHGGAAELTLPLTYFDHMWFVFGYMRRILFYKLSISKLDFVQNIIPTLKHSLSLTLKHYTPLVGNIACPLNSSGYPELCYVTGDSVSDTFTETDMDFNHLIDFIGLEVNKKRKAQVLESLFDYLRSVIKDPYKQGTIIWDEMKQNMPEIGDIIVIPPLDRVRGTFIMERNNIVKLKNLILSRRPNLSYVTSFTITCAYIWTCLIKSKFAIEDEMIDEDVMEIFGCVADCRSRLNPPLPQSYFGNCLVTIASKASRVELVGKEGFITAVEVIGEAIKSQMKDVELILNCSWYREFCGINMKHTLSVSGSPKFNLYEVDFGWGRPEKIEIISIDNSSGISMSISKYKDSHGDLEVGLSLPKTRMNAFVAIFNHGLSFL
ncbi:phenolic glucoside malonyltransferase 1 isoform X1 [Solanum lycopersicum]|uniref:phenolic glucoside malonyltransferase 1 isoform X1 n=1 Tax=Solanum lycopersicum TaxID=4081 RepID=UPI00374A7C1C